MDIIHVTDLEVQIDHFLTASNRTILKNTPIDSTRKAPHYDNKFSVITLDFLNSPRTAAEIADHSGVYTKDASILKYVG